MADKTDKKETKKLSLSSKGTLSLKAPVNTGAAGPRQGIAVGRSSKPVAVEVKKKRGTAAEAARQAEEHAGDLSSAEREARIRALQQAQQAPRDPAPKAAFQTKVVVKNQPAAEEPAASETPAAPDAGKSPADIAREQEMAKLRQLNEVEAAERKKRDAERSTNTRPSFRDNAPAAPGGFQNAKPSGRRGSGGDFGRDGASPSVADEINRRRGGLSRYGEPRRRSSGKMNVQQVMTDGFEDRDSKSPSLAAQRRRRENMRMKMMSQQASQTKQIREVIIPEVITVQELANRMAERVGDVVKKLMGMGIMATATQSIDTDTAELIVMEFGHTSKRVAESDVETGILGAEDSDDQLLHRPPVVTIMGHVDHGKTSLLDAIRQADVAGGEAGGITQHIGAYQITTKSQKKITFIDTPGHAAFTEMRARGADVTDIVVLVVAADDSVMPQTVEAISHAKAAGKPLIVAINKCDLPTANPQKVRTELLQHDVVTEDMGGDTQFVEVSAKTKLNMEQLEEAILLQAEVLNLRANPDRTAVGAVIEARQEQGKGSVATVLVQKGTLKVGDVFVTGSEWGRIRALYNDRGQQVKTALPGQPIETLGLNGTPDAGDDFVVVADEAKAREIAEFRVRRKRALQAAKLKGRGGIDQMIQNIQAGEAKSLPIIIKGDVHGSIEAIATALNKLTEENTEVKVNVLHTGVGAVTESDITLANASNALIVGFNVRANPQARDMAKRDGVEIRYYSIIYEVIDEVKNMLSGLLSPELKEKFIGYADIRQVFNITDVGKVAGCFVTEGIVKRGAKVRLLRDNVVIHEGTLKTLRRFKDEVKEVQKGYECGMAFEKYDDIKEGDVIEAFEIESTARTLEESA